MIRRSLGIQHVRTRTTSSYLILQGFHEFECPQAMRFLRHIFLKTNFIVFNDFNLKSTQLFGMETYLALGAYNIHQGEL